MCVFRCMGPGCIIRAYQRDQLAPRLQHRGGRGITQIFPDKRTIGAKQLMFQDLHEQVLLSRRIMLTSTHKAPPCFMHGNVCRLLECSSTLELFLNPTHTHRHTEDLCRENQDFLGTQNSGQLLTKIPLIKQKHNLIIYLCPF